MLKEIKIFTPAGVTKIYIPEKVAKTIVKENASIRDTNTYISAEDEIIDKTMSCSPEEALRWFVVEMKDALSKGTGEPDTALRAQFLAAYDLYERISAKYAA